MIVMTLRRVTDADHQMGDRDVTDWLLAHSRVYFRRRFHDANNAANEQEVKHWRHYIISDEGDAIIDLRMAPQRIPSYNGNFSLHRTNRVHHHIISAIAVLWRTYVRMSYPPPRKSSQSSNKGYTQIIMMTSIAGSVAWCRLGNWAGAIYIYGDWN